MPGVTRWKVGDRVAPIFVQRWLGGDLLPEYMPSALGGPSDGVLAEQIVLSEEGLVRIPSHLSFEQAATLPCAAVTAWNAALVKGALQAGSDAGHPRHRRRIALRRPVRVDDRRARHRDDRQRREGRAAARARGERRDRLPDDARLGRARARADRRARRGPRGGSRRSGIARAGRSPPFAIAVTSAWSATSPARRRSIPARSSPSAPRCAAYRSAAATCSRR